jgi:hypothetical protein
MEDVLFFLRILMASATGGFLGALLAMWLTGGPCS